MNTETNLPFAMLLTDMARKHFAIARIEADMLVMAINLFLLR